MLSKRYMIFSVVAAAIVLAGYQIGMTAGEEETMKIETNCTDGPVARSRCMIDAVLDDIAKTYDQAGGGGIKEIKLMATDTYRVAIAQEGRADLFTYKLSLGDDGAVVIESREEGTKNYGE